MKRLTHVVSLWSMLMRQNFVSIWSKFSLATTQVWRFGRSLRERLTVWALQVSKYCIKSNFFWIIFQTVWLLRTWRFSPLQKLGKELWGRADFKKLGLQRMLSLVHSITNSKLKLLHIKNHFSYARTLYGMFCPLSYAQLNCLYLASFKRSLLEHYNRAVRRWQL